MTDQAVQGEKRTNNAALVVIPAYNEEKNIACVIENIRKNAPFADIALINDGSSDATAELAEKAGAKVINLPFNMGYGAALQTGFLYAKGSAYQYVIQIDGDGQHDSSFIPSLLEAIENNSADVVLGSRFLRKDWEYKAPFARRIGILLFSSIASTILGQRITDPTSGFQALNHRAIRFYASDAYPKDFPDADVIIMLHLAGLRIKEIPVRMYSSNEKSMHSGLKPLYYIFKMFLSILVTLFRKWPKEELKEEV